MWNTLLQPGNQQSKHSAAVYTAKSYIPCSILLINNSFNYNNYFIASKTNKTPKLMSYVQPYTTLTSKNIWLIHFIWTFICWNCPLSFYLFYYLHTCIVQHFYSKCINAFLKDTFRFIIDDKCTKLLVKNKTILSRVKEKHFQAMSIILKK